VSELPPALRAAIERALEGRPRAGLAERAARTSAAYREGQGSAGAIRDADDALAYALTRLPATYAACRAALSAAADRLPGFAPCTLLDVGVGTGAASWAALEVWPGIGAAAWLDASRPFLDLCRGLSAEGPEALRDASGRIGDISTDVELTSSELVTASYVLAEVAPARQADAVARLWGACTSVLALVEPGTPAGYARLMAARTQLIARGAAIVAPCPHDGACPLTPPDWCHFAVRLPRSRDHRQVKGVALPFEDEKFAYLIVARPSVALRPAAARVLALPRAGKPGIALKLCTPAGLDQRIVARRDKAAHAAARRLGWGDAWNDPSAA
jgi:ribosomal protein RSM22 (predicted rRNA methylase)